MDERIGERGRQRKENYVFFLFNSLPPLVSHNRKTGNDIYTPASCCPPPHCSPVGHNLKLQVMFLSESIRPNSFFFLAFKPIPTPRPLSLFFGFDLKILFQKTNSDEGLIHAAGSLTKQENNGGGGRRGGGVGEAAQKMRSMVWILNQPSYLIWVNLKNKQPRSR